MRSCCCSLVGTDSCLRCRLNTPIFPPYVHLHPQKITVIEKLDEKGNAVERITTTESEKSLPYYVAYSPTSST